jgi:hypothetical protein
VAHDDPQIGEPHRYALDVDRIAVPEVGSHEDTGGDGAGRAEALTGRVRQIDARVVGVERRRRPGRIRRDALEPKPGDRSCNLRAAPSGSVGSIPENATNRSGRSRVISAISSFDI